MRAALFVALVTTLPAQVVLAEDAGPAAAGATDDTVGDAGPAAEQSPLEKARALANDGKVDEAVAAYEAGLVTLSNDDLATAYCEVALLLSKSDSGTDDEARARVARYVEACLARRPGSDEAFSLALKYQPTIVQQLGPDELIKREKSLRESLQSDDAEATKAHRAVIVSAIHTLHLTGRHDEAAPLEAEFKKRYDENGEATCILAEASFSRWSNAREDDGELDRAQTLMASCLEQQPDRRDMPGLYNDLLLFRYSRPVLLGGSALLLLAAVGLSLLRRKKGGGGET